MEFPFDINLLLPTEIVLISTPTRNFQVHGIQSCDGSAETKYTVHNYELGYDPKSFQFAQDNICELINLIGHKSAEAQDLKQPITTAVKLLTSDHRLYMIKDAAANKGNGALVGILKVGTKKLFLPDDQGKQTEVNPVCLLDFYVHHSKQRQGYGLRLFKIMLQLEGKTPEQLAIDRPSKFLLNFLKKHYNLEKPHFHPNKYVIFPGFFNSLSVKYQPYYLLGENGEPTSVMLNCKTTDQDEDKNISQDEGKSSNIPNTPYHAALYTSPSPSTVKSLGVAFLPTSSERKWQQMYESWHVLGVPPRDYSYIKNARFSPQKSEIR